MVDMKTLTSDKVISNAHAPSPSIQKVEKHVYLYHRHYMFTKNRNKIPENFLKKQKKVNHICAYCQ